MNKRKRGLTNGKGPEATTSSEEPVVKISALSRGLQRVSSPQVQQVRRQGTSKQEEHEFRVPSARSKKRSKETFLEEEVQIRPRNSNDDMEISTIKTPEQERYTNSCREMRKAVIILISNFHKDIQNLQKVSCPKLIDNLFTCWEKYPLMFASASRIPKSSLDDLSDPSEIRDFLHWWLHGLSSLLFLDELRSFRNDLKDVLKTFAQFLTYGNPDLVEVCFLELLQVFSKFSLSNPMARICLEGSDINPLDITIKICKSNFDAIPEFLEIIRAFLPRTFYFKNAPRQMFMNALRKLWLRLDDGIKYKFLSTLMPIVSLIPTIQIPTEFSVVKFLNQVMTDGMVPQNVNYFQNFCTILWKGKIPFSIFPETFLVRLHRCISNIIVSKQFNSLESESQRKSIFQVYFSLTKEKFNNGNDGQMLQTMDMDTLLRRTQAYYSFENISPLIEDLIVRDLQKAFGPFDQRVFFNHSDMTVPARDRRILEIKSESVSWLWNRIAADFNLAMSSFVIEDQSLMLSTLKKTCFTIQLAAAVNIRLVEFVKIANRDSIKNSVLWIPDFKLLSVDQLITWTELVGKCVADIFSNQRTVEAPDKILSMILETMKAFHNGKFLNVKLPLSNSCQWVSIAGAPWYLKFKCRLPKKFFQAGILCGIKVSSFENLHVSTKAKCLLILSLEMFLPWKDFVCDIIATAMETFSDNQSITTILELIKNYSWPIRSIPFRCLVRFLDWTERNCEWQRDTKIRNNLAAAIVKLPCFYTNERLRSSNINAVFNVDRIELEIGNCKFCASGSNSELEAAYSIPNDQLLNILRLTFPILKSEFLLAKLELSQLIITSRNHNKEFCQDLIGAFTSTAVFGKVFLGSEIMKRFGTYFAIKQTSLVYKEPEFDRKEGIEFMFNTLEHFLKTFFDKDKFLRFATKMLLILLELATNADQLMAVQILKYCMRLIMPRDSNVVNMQNQHVCAALAAKFSCYPWELMTRLRYDLAPEMLTLVLGEFCDFQNYDRDIQGERFRAFLSGIAMMGDYRSTTMFIHHYYPVLLGNIVPSLYEDCRLEFVLKSLSDFASIPSAQILQNGFHNYYRVLVLGHGSDRVGKCFNFLKQKFDVDHSFLVSNVLQLTLNEMLCHLDDRKDKVIKFIPQLLQRDGSIGFVAKTVLRSEIQELLSKHMMGFFLFVDTKLHSRLESIPTKRKILKSFTVLIELMGKIRMTSHRSKVYRTLNSLFALGSEFHDLLYESWKTFALNLENTAFGQMSAQILAAILILRETMPSQVDNLISHFVCAKIELTRQYHQDLYFLLDCTKDVNVLSTISDCITKVRSSSWVNYFELLVKESCHENSHIRYRAIKKLHDVLIEEHEHVQNLILDREHPVVSQVLNSFLNASRDADNEMIMLIAKSFGFLGAVDPYRFKDSASDEIKRKSVLTLTVDGANFAAKYLDLVIREYLEAEDITDFDYCSCLIQQLLQHFRVKPCNTDPVWFTMSKTAREAAEPLLTTKYKVEKELFKPNMKCPIYLSENGKTFDQWLSNWLSHMMTFVDNASPAYQLFQFSKYMVPRNNRIASFLLPYVATYAVIGATDSQKKEMVIEIENILQKWKEQDALKVNSQILIPVKEIQTELGTPEPETKAPFEEDVIQYRCTQEVFSVFDHLVRVVRQATRQAGLSRAIALQKPRQSVVDTINPCLTEESTEKINLVLVHIPMNTVSKVSFHCEDYKRALFYVELDLKKNPEKLQDTLSYLEELYLSLNDLDSVIGVATVRKREPTMSEVVCENFASRKVEAGVRSLELMVSADPNDLIAINGLIQAYLDVDEPRKAETLIKGCISRNPQWEVALHEFQIEAAWKLRDWSLLQTHTKETSTNSLMDVSLSWNMSIVKILGFVQDLKLDIAQKYVNETRVKLMSLVAAANDYNAYSRGYPNIVQLHILTEVEQMINLLQDSEQLAFSTGDRIKSLIRLWNTRLSVLLKSPKFTEPVLNVRKTLLEKLKATNTNLGGEPLALLDGSIRDCWLTVARVASKAGNFTHAQNCIVEAKKYMSAKVMIEHVKLLSRKGEKEHAIQILQSGITNYFPEAEGWRKKNSNRKTYSDEMKVCSEALLLHAKLCDEQQLLDIEMNIINYKSAIDVFANSEKNYFTLGGYYDRIWSNSEDKFRQSETQALVVKYYAMSLHYGSKYVYQSLPRLLSIWFDYASIGYNISSDNVCTDGPNGGESQPLDWSATISQMNITIKHLLKEVPAYVLLTAFSQLISRLCHGNPSVWELLKDILGTIICTHAHQALWMTMAVSKSSYETRKARCMEVYKSVEKKKAGLKRTIENYTALADRLIELCIKDVDKSCSKASLERICRNLPRFLQSSNFGDVLVPFQVFMNPSLPPKGSGHKNYDAFPQKFVFIKGVEDVVEVMPSLVRPKKITLIGSNGKRYGVLCKAKDDLRKDCKVMEVNSVVNWYLHRNPDSRERQLHVRIYAVTPLNEEHGLLEWVPNLSGIRGCIMSLHRERNIIIPLREFKSLIRPTDSLSVKREKFLTKFLKPFPAVFGEWFLNNFNDPQSWYNARMSYVRTAAVMSIVGFIFGLGDRHGENILIDSSTGDIVHVDFNCIFNKGETFDYPERVPFRLTQNMVDGMGPLGVEGVFRRSCEITMNMIREHKNVFLSVLRPFVFDPLVEWETGSSCRSYNSTGETSNMKAVEHMKHIKNRINGSARNFTKDTNSELSVEAQVAYLIDEARNPDNLCRMFLGWAAFM